LTVLALATAAGASVQESGVQARPVESGRVERVNTTVSYLDGQGTALFRYEGAEYIKVHLASVLLLPGDYLTVGNADGSEQHRVTEPGWAMSVTGDTARIELHRSTVLSTALAQLGVAIDKVARGYTEPERTARAEASRKAKQREESVCGGNDQADAVCYRSADPVIYRRAKAVARLLIRGVELCTAFRVGATNRMMTNHHCVGNAEDAADTEVWFNYQCAECGGYEVFRPTKVWLGEVLASDKTLDYTLFTVTDFAAVQKFGYLELDPRRPAQGEELYIPQHPTGAPGTIAINSDQDQGGNCAIADNSYDGYGADTDVSYYCDTEGGSSGSPVLSRGTNKVVALHHFGGCPNSGVRMELIYERLKTLL
jgi:lysyl endopeptidase